MSNEQVSEGRPDEFLAFSKFKEEIENQASENAKVILDAGKAEAENIKKFGMREADRYKSELLAKAKSEANQIKVREISRKKLSVKMNFIEMRDKVFSELILEAKSKIQEFTKSSQYSEFLESLVRETVSSINGGGLILHLRSEDKSLLSQDILNKIASEISKETNNETKITVAKSDLEALGGIKIIREDNKMYIDNTFEARLNRKDEAIKVSLVDILES